VTNGNLRIRTVFAQSELSESGGHIVPSSRGKTSSSVPDLPTPNASRCSCCRRQCARNSIRDFNRNTESIVEDWRGMAASPIRGKRRAEWPNRRAEGRKRVAWWHDQAAAIEAENVRAGIPGLTDAMDRANELEGEIETAIRDTPAGSGIGIAVKLRLVLRLGGNLPENFDHQDLITLSALRDAERLAG
jgi:hypothetical protein